VNPRLPDRGRYGDKLKASSPKTCRVIQLIQPKRQLNTSVEPGMLAIILVSLRSSTESTQPPSTIFSHQPNSPQIVPSYFLPTPRASQIPLSPVLPTPALIDKSPFVKLQPHLHNSSLLLTNIEKLNTLNLHFQDRKWPDFFNSFVAIGSSCKVTRSSNSQLDSNETNHTITTLVETNSPPHVENTCPTETSTSYHLSSLKPPRSSSHTLPKKHFHPYPKSFSSKKIKLDNCSPSLGNDDLDNQNVALLSSSPSDELSTARVAGYNLPPPSQ
jgi:hypothetical protein